MTRAGCHEGKLPAARGRIVRTAPLTPGHPIAAPPSCSAVDAPRRVAHIRRLGGWDDTGFTGSCRSPFVHQARRSTAGQGAPGRRRRRTCGDAVARICSRRISSIRCRGVKLGIEACQAILQAGANDFGGTLMEETISRMAGAEWGIRMTPDGFDDAIRAIGRVPAVRTTTYDRVDNTRNSQSA